MPMDREKMRIWMREMERTLAPLVEARRQAWECRRGIIVDATILERVETYQLMRHKYLAFALSLSIMLTLNLQSCVSDKWLIFDEMPFKSVVKISITQALLPICIT
ncbi:hypothetical protein BDQ12DRAFT_685406 [Crucibulum laeve]|uniref:Uncharacterized protein n=1 Tax=Crucibulum laeve TaxID=68775 RepID=A0A5C3LY58_9AGAR|nr:hypothetical protein BDQ12DRAFT_685406 [Crucibulum laeve]